MDPALDFIQKLKYYTSEILFKYKKTFMLNNKIFTYLVYSVMFVATKYF